MKLRAVDAAPAGSALLPPADAAADSPVRQASRGASRAVAAPPQHRLHDRLPWAEVALVALLALVVRLVYLDHSPYIDELNHALAARSLLEDGTLRINGGSPYARSWLYTLLVAGMVALLGDTLVVGRIPAVVAGTVLVAAVFLWTRSVANRSAAWIAAVLLCFAPISIYLSQQVRFYTLHALLFWLGAVAVYGAVTGVGRRRKALLLAASAVCFALAFHLQPTTAVGVLAVCAWVAVDRIPALARQVRARRWRGPAAVAILVAAGLFALLATGVLERGASLFGYADAWAAHNRDNVRFYHDLFVSQFASLWTLLPLLFLLGASRWPRPAVFFATVFATAFLVHSLAAWKHERYIFYALPFFFATAALGIAAAVPWLWSRFDDVVRRGLDARPPGPLVSTLFALVLAVSALFAAAGNGATSYAYKMLTVPDTEWRMPVAYRGEAEWRIALPELRAAAAESEIVLATSMLKALYYLDRVDAGLTATEVQRSRSGSEFAIARKEAVPVISTPESLQHLVACFPSGLVIAEQRNWRHAWGVPDATADLLETTLTRVPVPSYSGVLAFRWKNSGEAADPGCRSVLPRRATPE
jgi:4-amino-4-deoxy-L-arabinose transferase-like glycosyltransferase